MIRKIKSFDTFLGVLILAAGLLGAESADACGGLFCANSPVDQNAERILFEVHDPGTISVTVEISYTGDPDKFSWIVPVSETPSEMSVAPPSSLRILDNATNVQIIPPPVTCTGGGNGDGDGDGDSDEVSTGAPETDNGVVVEDLPVVGPYDPEVISSDDPEALIDWLSDNEYLITDEMKPYIAEYVEAGYKFMGVKLIPDAGILHIS
jgi:hypothetical protein